MIYEIKLDIKDYATLNIYTNSEIIKGKLMSRNTSITRTIPITNITCKEVSRNDICYKDAIVIIDSGKKWMYYEKKYNVSVLNANENDIRFPDIVYVSLAMFSRILARKEKYLLHSSSLVHPSNKGFVLVGDANAGKTSLAYELMSKHGCKLISNDHSIIGVEDGKPMILGGTKEIQMRLGAIELYFPTLYEKINRTSPDKWNEKLVVNDFIDSGLILPSSNDKSLLTNVFSINTTSEGEPFIRQKDSIDEFLFLYESMAKIIKGTYNYITGFDYPMPSMEDEQTLAHLSNLCKTIVKDSSVCEAKGSIDGLAKTLVKKYEK